MAKIDGATLIARSLKQQGVEIMFGIVGFPVFGIAAAAQRDAPRAGEWQRAAGVCKDAVAAATEVEAESARQDRAAAEGGRLLGGMRQRAAGATLDRLERWLAGAKGNAPTNDAPLFLWVHFFDPHADYEAPGPWPDALAGDAYAAEIAYTDRMVGRLLRVLDRARTLGRAYAKAKRAFGRLRENSADPDANLAA